MSQVTVCASSEARRLIDMLSVGRVWLLLGLDISKDILLRSIPTGGFIG